MLVSGLRSLRSQVRSVQAKKKEVKIEDVLFEWRWYIIRAQIEDDINGLVALSAFHALIVDRLNQLI